MNPPVEKLPPGRVSPGVVACTAPTGAPVARSTT